MKKLKLFVDMDEVLCDLSDAIRKSVNRDFGENFQKGYNKSYWWQDYGIQQGYFEYLLNKEGLFYNLEPIEGAIEVLTKLHKEGYDIHILTCPQRNRDCFYEKVMWIKKYLPFIDIEKNFHTTGNKGLFAAEDRLLIDDNTEYLNQWCENDGCIIVFNQSWNKDFEGDRAYNWNEVYDIVKQYKTFDEYFEKIDIEIFRMYMKGSYHE